MKALYTNTPPKVKRPCSRMHLSQQGLLAKVKDSRTMANERMTTKRFGHQVGKIVGRGNALKVDLLALDCITNKVELDAKVASPE